MTFFLTDVHGATWQLALGAVVFGFGGLVFTASGVSILRKQPLPGYLRWLPYPDQVLKSPRIGVFLGVILVLTSVPLTLGVVARLLA